MLEAVEHGLGEFGIGELGHGRILQAFFSFRQTVW